MAKKKLNELDPATLTLTRLIGHGHPSTGKMNRSTVGDLVALFAAQTPVKTYTDIEDLLDNDDLSINYLAFVTEAGGDYGDPEITSGWGLYLYNGPAVDDLANYTLIASEEGIGGGGTDHFKGVFASEAALEAAFPTGAEGDYAFVDTGGTDASLFIWDDTDSDWIESGVTTVVPDASETAKGIIEIATQAETNTGTDDVRALTPLKLKNQNFLAPLASPALTGTPTAPTAAGGTNTTQIATTAFVQAAVSLNSATPSTAGGTITLDMNSQQQRMHVGSASFSAAKIIAMSNTTGSLQFQFIFEVTSIIGVVLTVPADWLMSSANFNGTDWTPPSTGKYVFGGMFDGTNWYVNDGGPYT